MKKTYVSRVLLACTALLLFFFLTSCAPTPDNAQIEAAIRASLSGEASPPELDFSTMEVPMRSSGSAGAVLWTADGEIQRNYTLKYDKATRAFAVTGFTTSRRGADGSYYPVPNDPSLVLTEFAPCFDFSDDLGQQYLLLYAGEGDDLTALRTTFESEKLPAMTAEQLADFEVCDLGGDTLILLVPRYRGLSVWVSEIEHQGDMMLTGAEVAHFGDKPVYIYCSFSDKLPKYEIHVSFDEMGEFFLTREALLESMK